MTEESGTVSFPGVTDRVALPAIAAMVHGIRIKMNSIFFIRICF